MAISQTYCDFATGNDYKGATFTDGAYTAATNTLVKNGAFAATKVNHWLYLESNDGGSIVAGYYKVATVPDANTVTLATDAGGGVDDDAAKCTQHDGTTTLPWRSVQGALDLTTQAAAGDQINVKAGTTQVLAATLVLTTYGTPTFEKPLIIRGYTAAANDGGRGAISGADSYAIISNNALNYISLIDLDLSHPLAGGLAVVLLNDYCQFINLDINAHNGTAAAAWTIDADVGSLVANCHLYGSYYAGIQIDNSSYIIGNYFEHGGSSPAIWGPGRFGIFAQGNIVKMTSDLLEAAIQLEAQNSVIGNIVYSTGANTSTGILVAEGHTLRVNSVILNNIVCGFSGAGGYGIETGAVGMGGFVGYNAFYNNTANYNAGVIIADARAGDVVLAADPFTDAANGDFSLTAAAKAALGSAGWPASYLGAHANTDPHITIGAIQLTATACDYPSEDDVRFGVDYDSAGQTGNMTLPAVADVQSGVQFGTSGTEYTGTFAVPAEEDVEAGVDYGAAAEYTGTFAAPAVAKVIDDTSYGAAGAEFTGTYKAVAVGDVQSGVTFGAASAETGTFASPAVGKVIDDTSFGAGGVEYTGTYHAPDVAEVIDTAVFGAASAEAGTVHQPDTAEVIDSAVFGPASAVSGIYHEAAAAEVQLGVTFGPAEAYTGTYDPAGGVADWTADEKKQIRQALGVTGLTAATSGTGNLDTAKTTTDKLDTTLELDGAVYRFTENALEQAAGTDAATIAAAILVTPANKLATDASGHVSISGTKTTLDSLSGADGDTLKDLSDEIAAIAVGAGLTAQEVRDAMKLAPTAGAPAAGSVDAHLDDILEDTGTTLDGLIDAIKAKTDALDVTGTPSVTSLIDGGDLTVIAGATFDPPAITGLTIPATWETGFFTVKAKKEGSGLVAAADSTALIQVKVSNPADGADGLLYLNGAAASSAAYGSLALDATAGTATIVVADDATVLLARRAGLFWDIKTLNSDGTSDVVCSGSLEVVLTPTKTV